MTENQNFEIFDKVVHNFGKPDDDIIYWNLCLFPIDAYMV